MHVRVGWNNFETAAWTFQAFFFSLNWDTSKKIEGVLLVPVLQFERVNREKDRTGTGSSHCIVWLSLILSQSHICSLKWSIGSSLTVWQTEESSLLRNPRFKSSKMTFLETTASSFVGTMSRNWKNAGLMRDSPSKYSSTSRASFLTVSTFVVLKSMGVSRYKSSKSDVWWYIRCYYDSWNIDRKPRTRPALPKWRRTWQPCLDNYPSLPPC